MSPQFSTINMTISRFATLLKYSTIALVLMCVCSSRAVAQDDHSHDMTQQDQELTPDQRSKPSALVKIVRESTERFKDVKVAEGEGYRLQFGCVSGDDFGAMGLHYVNGDLVNSGVLDATRPQIVIYEPMPDGGLQLIGADYLVIADAVECSAFGSAGAHGTALSFVRRAPIASGSRPSTRCMSGRGRRIPMARS